MATSCIRFTGQKEGSFAGPTAQPASSNSRTTPSTKWSNWWTQSKPGSITTRTPLRLRSLPGSSTTCCLLTQPRSRAANSFSPIQLFSNKASASASSRTMRTTVSQLSETQPNSASSMCKPRFQQCWESVEMTRTVCSARFTTRTSSCRQSTDSRQPETARVQWRCAKIWMTRHLSCQALSSKLATRASKTVPPNRTPTI